MNISLMHLLSFYFLFNPDLNCSSKIFLPFLGQDNLDKKKTLKANIKKILTFQLLNVSCVIVNIDRVSRRRKLETV